MLTAIAAPMIATGYLLQVTTAEGWRSAWTWIHVATSLTYLAAWLAHANRSFQRYVASWSSHPGSRIPNTSKLGYRKL